VEESSITNLTDHDELALVIGRRVRARRLAVGLTQTELGEPLTKGFVSAVEGGHTLPSLRALLLFADRLGVGLDDLAGPVKRVAIGRYTPGRDAERASRHDPQPQAQDPRGRR
jgi:transcriptional regulator with XRE-family HTH domain